MYTVSLYIIASRTWSYALIDCQILIGPCSTTGVALPTKPLEIEIWLKPSQWISDNIDPSWWFETKLSCIEVVMVFEDE